MRRLAVILFLGGFLVIVACLVLPSGTMIYDDGLWPLSVTVQSRSEAPIAWVTCQAFTSADDARYSFENAIPGEGVHSAMQKPFQGDKVVVPVPSSLTTRSSFFGTRTRFSQSTKLVVVVWYPSGERSAEVVDIPDMRDRKAREVTVTFP